jgi:hypothetical protein
VPWSGLQIEFLERTPEKKASAEPSTKNGIEPVLFAASLSRLTSRSTQRYRFSSLTLNSAG